MSLRGLKSTVRTFSMSQSEEMEWEVGVKSSVDHFIIALHRGLLCRAQGVVAQARLQYIRYSQ